MPLALRLKYLVDQFFIFQKMICFDHPRLPKCPDILGHDAFPECSLPLFAARHDPLCGHSETGSIVNVLAPPAPPKSSPVRRSAVHFATESNQLKRNRTRCSGIELVLRTVADLVAITCALKHGALP